jgi:hemolysin III
MAYEMFSAISHGFGAVLSLTGLIALLIRGFVNAVSGLHFLAYTFMEFCHCAIFSHTLYHSVRTSLIQRLRLRKFDHSMIYVLIAGSYTPICLLSIPQQGGILMLILVWCVALFGVITSVFWIDKPRWLSASLYLGMGWMALMVIKPLLANLPPGGLLWLLLGGIFYSVGAIFYALKWPGRDHPIFGFHEIFHFFVLAGSISHYCMIFCYLS